MKLSKCQLKFQNPYVDWCFCLVIKKRRSGNFSFSIPICFYQIQLEKKLHFVTPPPTQRRHNFASHFFEFFLSAWPSMDTFSPFFFFIIYYLSAYYFPRILDAILRFIKLDIFRYIPLSFYYFKILGSFHKKKYSQTWSPLIDICRAQSVILYPNANDLSSIFLCQSSEIIASRQKHNRPKMYPVHSTFVYALFQ